MRLNKKSLKINNFSKIISLIYLICYIATSYIICFLNILPIKFLALYFVISIILTIFILIILFKQNSKLNIKIITIIFSIIFIIIFAFISYYSYHTLNFMDKLNEVKYQTEEFYVITKNDSEISDVNQIANNKVYILKNNESVFVTAKANLLNIVKVDYVEKESVDEIKESLDSGNVIFISNSIYSLLCEEKYDISNYSKIIYTIKINTDVNDITKNVKVTDVPFNIFISGIDTKGSITNVARSDVNMIVTFNPQKQEILLTSIPRDYYVKLHSSGVYDKLTHSGIYGINESITTVEDLLDCDINYYVRVNFSTLVKVVDTIGGISVNSDYSFTTHGTGKKYTFTKGTNYLNGEQALAFSRERKSFEDGDRQRIKNQQLVMTAIINKVTNNYTLLAKYSELLNILGDSFQTNFTSNDITSLVKEQINNMNTWEINNYSLNGYDALKTTYTYGSQQLYVMVPDNTTVEIAKQNIEKTMNE